MRIIDNLKDGLPVFDALSNEIRINIIQLLLKHHQMNMNEIAKALQLPKSTLTPHMKKLVQADLIEVSLNSERRGTQKICKLLEDKIIIDIIPQPTEQKMYETELDAGQYSDCFVAPTCGLASCEKVIGNGFDDPRYFHLPDRFSASIVWFSKGYVEYTFANLLSSEDTPVEMQIFLEMCSEAPGVLTYYPSDIHFTVNGLPLG